MCGAGRHGPVLCNVLRWERGAGSTQRAPRLASKAVSSLTAQAPHAALCPASLLQLPPPAAATNGCRCTAPPAPPPGHPSRAAARHGLWQRPAAGHGHGGGALEGAARSTHDASPRQRPERSRRAASAPSAAAPAPPACGRPPGPPPRRRQGMPKGPETGERSQSGGQPGIQVGAAGGGCCCRGALPAPRAAGSGATGRRVAARPTHCSPWQAEMKCQPVTAGLPTQHGGREEARRMPAWERAAVHATTTELSTLFPTLPSPLCPSFQCPRS